MTKIFLICGKICSGKSTYVEQMKSMCGYVVTVISRGNTL